MIKTFKSTINKLPDGMQVEAVSEGFKMIFDEPLQMGGTNKGVNPMSALLSVMGACQTIIAFMFAKHNDIQLNHFSVEIEGDMDMNAIMKQERGKTGFQEIRYKMIFDSPNSDEELMAFGELIEELCPVSQSLKKETKIVNTGLKRK